MNHISSEHLVEKREVAAAGLPAAARTMLIWTAWISTLLLSNLPLVIARDVLGSDIPWITIAWIGTAGLLFAVTYVWQVLRPLRGYFIIMGMILLMGFWVDPFIRQTTAWRNLFAGQSQMIIVFGDRVLLLLRTSIVLAALFWIGIKPREAFLAVGNLKAPVGGQTSASRRRVLTWSVLGPVAAVLLGGLFITFLASQNPGALSGSAAVLPWLPLILLSAALNAFGEEAKYRAAPLATLLPAVGPRHAIWLTSLWFGLGHYYGGFPSGPVGLVYSGLLALLLGKAMLDTRGMGWSWTIHVVIDTIIYCFMAATMG